MYRITVYLTADFTSTFVGKSLKCAVQFLFDRPIFKKAYQCSNQRRRTSQHFTFVLRVRGNYSQWKWKQCYWL